MVSLEEYIMLNYDLSEEENEETPQFNTAENPFQCSENKFRKNYRLSKCLTRNLIREITPFMKEPDRSSEMSIQCKVLTALNFFATGSYQNPVGSHRNAKICQSSVSKSVSEVVAALNNPAVFGHWVHFPQNIQELRQKSQRFYQLHRLPGVIGCIDCTHVAIHPPPNNEIYDERSYVNRKGYHSINVQLICDADLKIINVNALYPGSTHDSFIWNQSAVLPAMQSIHRSINEKYYLIGDSGYAFRPWLHTPIMNPVMRRQERYNEVLKSARATIERCNGVLKMRFRCLLKHRVLHYLPEKAIKMINSCCVLHNMCLWGNVPDVEEEEGDSEIDLGLYQVDHVPEDRSNNDLIIAESLRDSIITNYF